MVIQNLILAITKLSDSTVQCTRVDGSTFNIEVFKQVDVNTLQRKTSIYISTTEAQDDGEVSLVNGSTFIKSDGSVYRREKGKVLRTKTKNIADTFTALEFIPSNVYPKGTLLMYNGVMVSVNIAGSTGEAIVIPDVGLVYKGLTTGTLITTSLPTSNVSKDTDSLHYKVGTSPIAKTIHSIPIASNQKPIPVDAKACLLFTANDGVYISSDNKLYNTRTGILLLDNVVMVAKFLNTITIMRTSGAIEMYRIGDYTMPIKRFPTLTNLTNVGSISTYGEVLAVFYTDSKKLTFYFNSDITVKEEIQLESTIEQAFYSDESVYCKEGNSLKEVELKLNLKPFDTSFIISKPVCASSFKHLINYYPTTTNSLNGFRDTFKASDSSKIIDIDTNNNGDIFAVTGSKLIRIHQTASTYDLSSFTVAQESIEDLSNSTGIVCLGEVIYVSFSGSKTLSRYDVSTLSKLGEYTKQVNGDTIQSISRGQTGDVSILTNVGTIYVYETITDSNTKKTSDISSAITANSKSIPLSIDGAWVSETSIGNSNIYKAVYKTGAISNYVKIPSTIPKAMCILGSKLLTVDLGGDGTIATYDSYIQTIKES